MNSLMNDNSDDDVEDLRGRRDKEITLGTTMVLAIFFGLAVLCAVFFGFGYSIGSKRSVPTSGPTAASSGSTIFNGFKPAAGSAAGAALPRARLPRWKRRTCLTRLLLQRSSFRALLSRSSRRNRRKCWTSRRARPRLSRDQFQSRLLRPLLLQLAS